MKLLSVIEPVTELPLEKVFSLGSMNAKFLLLLEFPNTPQYGLVFRKTYGQNAESFNLSQAFDSNAVH